VRIPRDLELPGKEAVIRKEGATLVLVPKRARSLLQTLEALEPLTDTFPRVKDKPPEPVDL
jgi:antitoxin VapB